MGRSMQLGRNRQGICRLGRWAGRGRHTPSLSPNIPVATEVTDSDPPSFDKRYPRSPDCKKTTPSYWRWLAFQQEKKAANTSLPNCSCLSSIPRKCPDETLLFPRLRPHLVYRSSSSTSTGSNPTIGRKTQGAKSLQPRYPSLPPSLARPRVRSTHVLVVPAPGLRVDGFTDRPQHPQRAKVVVGDDLRPAAHERSDGRGCCVELRHLVSLDDVPVPEQEQEQRSSVRIVDRWRKRWRYATSRLWVRSYFSSPTAPILIPTQMTGLPIPINPCMTPNWEKSTKRMDRHPDQIPSVPSNILQNP